MGRFEGLDGLGQKLAKFKQDKLIEVLKDQRKITVEEYGQINAGACTAICMAWVKSKYEPSAILGFHRAENIKAADNLASQEIAKLATSKQINYVRAFKEHGEASSIRSLATEERLKFEGILLDDGDFYAVVDGCQTKLRQNEAAIVCANLDGSDTGHAIALHKPNFNILSFFDPNAGEYLVLRDNMELFLNTYKRILKDGGWAYTWTTAYRIGP
jgi:Yersinia/Haemophilus virulence surface antigen